jgi:hypothetical protein
MGGRMAAPAQVLSQLEGVDLELYKTAVLPRILEQVVSCKDDIAQPYLMDAVIQVFPDEFHLQTLETLLAVCPQLQGNVKVGGVLAGLMTRLAKYAADVPEVRECFCSLAALTEQPNSAPSPRSSLSSKMRAPSSSSAMPSPRSLLHSRRLRLQMW